MIDLDMPALFLDRYDEFKALSRMLPTELLLSIGRATLNQSG